MTNLDCVPPWGPVGLMLSPVSSVNNGDPTLRNPRSMLRGPQGERRAARSLLFLWKWDSGISLVVRVPQAHGVDLAVSLRPAVSTLGGWSLSLWTFSPDDDVSLSKSI